MSGSNELTISQSAFEGLFGRVLKPQGAFREALKRVGYDMDREVPAYPLATWDAALKVAARHAHAGVPQDEALRRLGAAFLGGFFETITGRLVSATLPMLGADTLMKKLPRPWAAAAPGTVVETRQLAPGRWEIQVRHPSPQPDFDTGMLTTLLGRVRARDVAVHFVERRPDGYTAEVRWAAA